MKTQTNSEALWHSPNISTFFPLDNIYFCKYSSLLLGMHHNKGMHLYAAQYLM